MLKYKDAQHDWVTIDSQFLLQDAIQIALESNLKTVRITCFEGPREERIYDSDSGDEAGSENQRVSLAAADTGLNWASMKGEVLSCLQGVLAISPVP